jgi:hypothetical protein
MCARRPKRPTRPPGTAAASHNRRAARRRAYDRPAPAAVATVAAKPAGAARPRRRDQRGGTSFLDVHHLRTMDPHQTRGFSQSDC